MTFRLARWNPLRRLQNHKAWHSSADGSATWVPSTGAGVHAGPHACGRAIIPVQDCGRKWTEACRAWDDVRADIRRIPGGALQAEAWKVATQALQVLQHHIRQQFDSDFEEVHHDVDY